MRVVPDRGQAGSSGTDAGRRKLDMSTTSHEPSNCATSAPARGLRPAVEQHRREIMAGERMLTQWAADSAEGDRSLLERLGAIRARLRSLLEAQTSAGAARVTFEAGLITSAILLVIAVLFDTRVIPQTGQGIAALLAMSYVSHAGGQGLLAIALGRLPATFSSLVIFLEAIAAAVFGWAILGEALTLIQSLGGALILFGIWVSRPRTQAQAG